MCGTFQTSSDFICRMSQAEVQLLADSGVSCMGFGTESTPPAVLKMMNKRHQRVDEMYETARKANLATLRLPSTSSSAIPEKPRRTGLSPSGP